MCVISLFVCRVFCMRMCIATLSPSTAMEMNPWTSCSLSQTNSGRRWLSTGHQLVQGVASYLCKTYCGDWWSAISCKLAALQVLIFMTMSGILETLTEAESTESCTYTYTRAHTHTHTHTHTHQFLFINSSITCKSINFHAHSWLWLLMHLVRTSSQHLDVLK